MADAGRLVELFKEACSLTGSEQEAFVRRVREDDSELGKSLAELLGQQGPVPTEPGSFAKKLEEQYGSEADPHISLEGESEGSDFASEIVQRLAGRGEAYGRYKLKGEVACAPRRRRVSPCRYRRPAPSPARSLSRNPAAEFGPGLRASRNG